MTSRSTTLVLVFLVAFASPAWSALPRDAVILTCASTVAQRSLPPLLNLDGRSYSSLELPEKFALAPLHESEDLLSYSVAENAIRVEDPTDFVPPSSHSHYYDPTTSGRRIPGTMQRKPSTCLSTPMSPSILKPRSVCKKTEKS